MHQKCSHLESPRRVSIWDTEVKSGRIIFCDYHLYVVRKEVFQIYHFMKVTNEEVVWYQQRRMFQKVQGVQQCQMMQKHLEENEN